ncbi:nucleotidyl transferase AbiEii/AbiGii toxin family protein [Candidatus Saganbacteria bacterium]|nr:nucleotidyl transferase AbiEii/AbiGii toxin family protein [Candidatus Saganbacteria bacterium]
MDIERIQDQTLAALSGKINDYYLAGGTALARFYFHHRQSIDLDFFSQVYSFDNIVKTMNDLSLQLGKEIELVATQNDAKFARMAVYAGQFPEALKIDFIEDIIKLIKPLNNINGINVMSLEDIYVRKLYALSGTVLQNDAIGRNVPAGGRVEAKDFFDVYFLSKTFLSLSDFVKNFGNNVIREGLIRWFRSYNRLDIKSGLLEIITNNPIDYQTAEKHFKIEIDKILKEEIGE